MKKIQFTEELFVSSLGLGGSHLGSHTDQKTSIAVLDAFLDAGGTMIDTAHAYGADRPEDKSKSEEVIGRWMESRRARDKVILCTKGGHPAMDPVNHYFGPARVSPEELARDLAMSLASLRTDYIDLYYLHRDDPSVPVSELLDFLEEQVKKGTIRYYGCSNWTSGRIKEAASYAVLKRYRGFVADQMPAPLAVFNEEVAAGAGMTCLEGELLYYHEQTGMPAVTAMTLCNGYFHKKLAGQEMPFFPNMIYGNERSEALGAKLALMAREGYCLNSILYQRIMAMPFPTSALMGFSNVAQLENMLSEIEHEVPRELLEELEQIRCGKLAQ